LSLPKTLDQGNLAFELNKLKTNKNDNKIL